MEKTLKKKNELGLNMVSLCSESVILQANSDVKALERGTYESQCWSGVCYSSNCITSGCM